MTVRKDFDWHVNIDAGSKDQVMVYDHMRSSCPVAYSERHGWSLFEHKDIERVLQEHQTFSNAVSKHRSVPNGMDPPEHTQYRKIIEPYFNQESIAAFEPTCRKLTAKLIDRLLGECPVEIISEFAQYFAVQIQCAFLGWPVDMQEPLSQWSSKNQDAILNQDKMKLKVIADEFNDRIKNLLQVRRTAGEYAPKDITTSLLNNCVNGRSLSDEDIVSILRNWTAGEIGTITSAIGILVYFITTNLGLQKELREQPEKIPEAIEEILRIQGPLITNRRIATRSVYIGGCNIERGQKLTLFWASANRDDKVFDDAQQFKWGRDQNKNFLYGAGIHICPGAPLARMELRIVMEELLNRTENLILLDNPPPLKATYPNGGFKKLFVCID